MKQTKIHLVSLAVELGARRISGAELGKKFKTTATEIRKLCGVTNLYHLSPQQDLVQMAANIISTCLESASLSVDQLSGIFGVNNYTTSTLMPTFTASVAAAMGMHDLIVDQVGIGCAGGMQALRNAYNQLMVDAAQGKESFYIVVMGDESSKMLEPTHFATNILFSEGVAAILLTNSPGFQTGYEVGNVGTTCLLGNGFDSLKMENPNVVLNAKKLTMKGDKVFRFAARTFPYMQRLVNITSMEGTYFIPHQANLRIIESMIEQYELDPGKVYTSGIRLIGNTLLIRLSC